MSRHDRLEKAGLIERRPHPKDRRGRNVVLTKEATRKLPPLFESLAKAMEALVSGYSEKELEVLADFFAKVSLLCSRNARSSKGTMVVGPIEVIDVTPVVDIKPVLSGVQEF